MMEQYVGAEIPKRFADAVSNFGRFDCRTFAFFEEIVLLHREGRSTYPN
jgi:hypothetical protein